MPPTETEPVPPPSRRAVTGLIAFALFLAGALLLWANAHYKDADGTLDRQRAFASTEYAVTSDGLEINGHWLLSSDRYGTVRLTARARGQARVHRRRPDEDVNAYLRTSPTA